MANCPRGQRRSVFNIQHFLRSFVIYVLVIYSYYSLLFISAVGIATRYGLEGPGIESRWGRDFPPLSRPALGPTQPPVQWVPGLSGGKAAGAWC